MTYMSYLLLLLVFVIFAYLLRLLWIRYTINRRLQQNQVNGIRNTTQVPYFIRVRDMIAAQQEQERHSREQEAAECPPKYEDVYDSATSIRQPVHTGAGGFYAPGGTGESGQEKGFTNPVFAEEPPPDYTSAVAQVGNMSDEAAQLPYQLAGVHHSTRSHPPSDPTPPYSAPSNTLPYPLSTTQTNNSTQRF